MPIRRLWPDGEQSQSIGELSGAPAATGIGVLNFNFSRQPVNGLVDGPGPFTFLKDAVKKGRTAAIRPDAVSPVTNLAESDEATEPHKTEELAADETPAQDITFFNQLPVCKFCRKQYSQLFPTPRSIAHMAAQTKS